MNKGSFKCECHKGFVTSDGGVTCEDIDECALTGKEKVCENATCKNTPGAYECTCNAGYKPKYTDDITSDCDDIDECKDSRSTDSLIVKLSLSRTSSCRSGLSGTLKSGEFAM